MHDPSVDPAARVVEPKRRKVRKTAPAASNRSYAGNWVTARSGGALL